MWYFVEVYWRRGLKVNVGKSKVMVLNEEEGLEREIHVYGMQLDLVSEFKYLRFALDERGTNEAEYPRKMANGRRVAGAIRSLVNVRGLMLEFARILHETLLMSVLMYGSEREEKERSRIRSVQMDSLRGC